MELQVVRNSCGWEFHCTIRVAMSLGATLQNEGHANELGIAQCNQWLSMTVKSTAGSCKNYIYLPTSGVMSEQKRAV